MTTNNVEDQKLPGKVQGLTDVELALLLCLIAKEHCIIHTTSEAVDVLEEEIQLIASNVFGLSASVLQCSTETTLEDFSNGILVAAFSLEEKLPVKSRSPSPNQQTSSYNYAMSVAEDGQRLPNVVVAKNLDIASRQIQIQALELLRTGRIFTHTAVHTTPRPFLFVILLSAPGPALVKHLNDHIFLSHYHDPEDGFANLEEGTEWIEDDRASQSSVVHRSIVKESIQKPLFSAESIQLLMDLVGSATISIDVKRYSHDILTFLRRHRAVAAGVTPQATKHFDLLARYVVACITRLAEALNSSWHSSLAPLHDLNFVTPSLVQLAARKVYRHRISIVAPEDERSMQYGSSLAVITALLEEVTPEQVIEEVLASIEMPL
ncbi:hypothetical protein MMC19_005354 [Ptychographa xylographoides]|nr:hypothetical protein [Ptychographa xylographoides]